MRLIRLLLLAVLIGAAAPVLAPVHAAPLAAFPLASQTAAPDLTENVRLYCYNRHTGRFLHWGPCYRRHYVRPRYERPHYYRPRHDYRPHYYHRYYYRPHYYYRTYYRHYYW